VNKSVQGKQSILMDLPVEPVGPFSRFTFKVTFVLTGSTGSTGLTGEPIFAEDRNERI
jgi:hypothetical protein